jgi:hypothetical protein
MADVQSSEVDTKLAALSVGIEILNGDISLKREQLLI